jgi:hypothetical protein
MIVLEGTSMEHSNDDRSLLALPGIRSSTTAVGVDGNRTGARKAPSYRTSGSSHHERRLYSAHSGQRDMRAYLSVMLTTNSPPQTQASTTTGSQCHTISAKLP